MKGRQRIDVTLDELDKVLDQARQAPLSEADYEKTQRRTARIDGDAGAAADYGEDQRGKWRNGSIGNQPRDYAGF